MKFDIVNNGPIIAELEVFEDFYMYKSGIYFKKAGNYLFSHTVKIIGYGEENGSLYWICANVWGD
jgi:cathepsin B